jgi:hypothetical protein
MFHWGMVEGHGDLISMDMSINAYGRYTRGMGPGGGLFIRNLNGLCG